MATLTAPIYSIYNYLTLCWILFGKNQLWCTDKSSMQYVDKQWLLTTTYLITHILQNTLHISLDNWIPLMHNKYWVTKNSCFGLPPLVPNHFCNILARFLECMFFMCTVCIPVLEWIIPESHGSGPACVCGENGVSMGASGIPVALCSHTLGQTIQEKSS